MVVDGSKHDFDATSAFGQVRVTSRVFRASFSSYKSIIARNWACRLPPLPMLAGRGMFETSVRAYKSANGTVLEYMQFFVVRVGTELWPAPLACAEW